ncbi:hypothetical protein D1AOALGA4SA_1918 [Olavius algarvensis Delta 1 endosymbiont]|nr:hypothetical protein D1AOALGA4SA_1918 [Olavius algarvensis Delta 1 endosymbiont]
MKIYGIASLCLSIKIDKIARILNLTMTSFLHQHDLIA